MLYKEIQNLENAARTAMSGPHETIQNRPLKNYGSRVFMRLGSFLLVIAILAVVVSIYLYS